MAASKNIEFDLDDNETYPNLIAQARTKFLFRIAEEEAWAFIEKEEDFKKLDEQSTKTITKLLVNMTVEGTTNKLKEKYMK